MKKKILLFTLVAGFSLAILTSGRNGAGAEKGYDCTGAETGLGNFTGCGGASGCHSTTASAGIAIGLELDSAGVPTTHYKGGMSYTVKITGTNNTTSTLTKFGFQVSCITGTTAVTTPTNAGTFASTGLPASVRYTAASLPSEFACNLIEHSDPIPATTGGGSTGSTYVESFPWTAPASGTGAVSFWGVLNAVLGVGLDTNSASTSDLWNSTHIAIQEWTTPSSVANVMNNISVIAFPNPVSNTLQLQMDETTEGTYALQVFGMDGRMVANDNIAVSGKSYTTSLNTSNWTPGMYSIVLSKDGGRKVIAVVKQ